MTREEIIQAIKEMTVLELNELVTACEEEFGVSAAAPVAVAGGAVAGAAAEEKTEFDVRVTVKAKAIKHHTEKHNGDTYQEANTERV